MRTPAGSCRTASGCHWDPAPSRRMRVASAADMPSRYWRVLVMASHASTTETIPTSKTLVSLPIARRGNQRHERLRRAHTRRWSTVRATSTAINEHHSTVWSGNAKSSEKSTIVSVPSINPVGITMVVVPPFV